MAGTAKDPFLDDIANCALCLDLNAGFLRRQWRRFGKLPPIDTRYGFTLKKLAENVVAGRCRGCQILSAAVELITTELKLQFANAQLEFSDEDPGTQGLCIRTTTLYPSYASEADWERAKEQPDLTVDFVTGPCERAPERPREWRISSPLYEIFHDDDHSETCGTAICKRTHRSGDTGSDDAIAWVKSRLEQCDSQHPACCSKDTAGLPLLPSRILDLGQTDYVEGSSLSPVLLDNTNGDLRGTYACLSHCWGPQEQRPLDTRLETVDSFQTCGVPWSDLPKTFQEAMVFTRRIGIRYLWIDSLCIIQDDADDWFREAGRMATTYENATLTLAATSSASSQEGLYRTSVPSWSLGGGNYLRRCSDPIFFEHRFTRNPAFVDRVAPLLRRAWVLQERLISRRLIQFTPLELVFECYSGTETESGVGWVNSSVKHMLSGLGTPKPDEPRCSTSDLVASRKMWQSLVEDFTHLQLTRNEDVLPATAGLAKKTMKLTGRSADDYLAGLWRQTFIEDLMWERVRSMRRLDRINKNIPTWSWAHDDMPKAFIDQGGESLAYLCDLVDGVCEPDSVSGDPFLGIQSGGHVILSGYLLPARYTSLGIAIDDNPRVHYLPSKDFQWSEESSDRLPVMKGDRVFAIPLVLRTSLHGAEGYGVDIHALVVRSSPGGQTYQRIGIFWTTLLLLSRQYDYILEGNDVLVKALEQHITFGEAALVAGSDSGASKAANKSAKKSDEITDTQYKNTADHIFLCMYGHKGARQSQNIDNPYSQAYLEILKELLRTEMDRRHEWIRRSELGLEQLCARTEIILE